MLASEFLEVLDRMEKAVFTTNDAVKIIGKKSEYVNLYIYRLKKRGKIEEIEKGKFALPGHPFSVASGLIFPSYISFMSGLEYYNLTTQMTRVIYVVSLESKRPIKLGDYEIRFVKIKKERFFGYMKEKYRGKFLFVGGLEKVIADSLFLPKYCPIDEVFNALKDAVRDNRIDMKKFLAYSVKMNSSVVLKRVGFMLEKMGYDCHSRVKNKLTKKYDLLNPLTLKKGKKDIKWMLYINEGI